MVSQFAPVWRVGRALLLALAFSVTTTCSIFAQGHALSGHIPQAVKAFNLQPVGRLAATNRLHLAIGLPLRNQDALNALLKEMYDPASPQYHQYLTPEQFAEKFGPTKEDYVAVMDFAKANHLEVTKAFPNRVLIDVEGSVADVEKALHVTMRTYNHPAEARTFFAPDTEPSLALAVPILHIGGLDNYSIPHPNSKRKPQGTAPDITPHSGSGPSGNYIGNDFRTAYVPGTTLTGSGQTVGLLQFDGYNASDITYYESLAHLPSVTLSNVLVDGATNGPSGNGGEIEVSLDIEMILSMTSGGVSRVILYIAPNPSPWEDLMHQMVVDNSCKQISCSWGGGSPDPTAEQALVQMAIQGQTFFNATGDSDAFTGAIPFPSDSTNVVEVGGTTLSTTGSGGPYASETVWNWGYDANCSCYVGSSGGISTYYSIPPWQQGVNMSSNQGSNGMRNVPDVALTADNVYVRADGKDITGEGGTSCAAPLWAGLTALINQQATANGKGTVGFLNPALYTIGTGTIYMACFHDITSGNNEWPSSPSKFLAVAGYDLCTGWGTPNGTNLINALAGPPTPVPNIVAAGSTLIAEGCTPTNGAIDPNETVTVNFALRNTGAKDASNVVVTLLATGGVTSPSAAQSYGTLLAGDGAVSQPFTFTANGTCGSNLTATLQIQTNSTNYGTVTYTFALGVSSVVFSQNFDDVTATNLPAGWTTSAGGAESLWVTSTTQRDTLPNAAFSPDPASIGSNALVSPDIPIASSQAKLTFRNNYSLETSYDGGVLDIKIGGGAFQDILTAGGTFTLGGYNYTISTSYGNPIGGRRAWSGSSGGFITTAVNLPAAAAGQNIQLRWMCGSDSSVSKPGWYIDTISISDLSYCTGTVYQPPVASFTGTPTNGIAPLSVTFSDTSTGSITNWFWNFGDGGTTNLATNGVVYAYNAAGVYTVSEIVTGPGGSSTHTQTSYIVVLTPFQGWQIQYFGNTNNPNAAPAADVDGTGQNNLFKFVAGLDPTNPASIFQLTIITDTNQPNAQDLQFLPLAGGRTYTPQFSTDLVNGVWFPLTTSIGPVTNGNQISVTDTNPLSPQEFYRISISVP